MACVTGFLPSLAVAQPAEEPSRLRCSVPKEWKPAGDGSTYLLPGQNVAVTFAASTPFAGTAEEWLDQYWQALGAQLKFTSEPVTAPDGQFLARIGTFQQAGGPPAWLCLHTLVRDGRGEAVLFMAGSEAEFGQHLPAVGRVLGSATIASTAAATGPASGAPASRTSQPGSGDTMITMRDYEFTPPARWQVQQQADHILLTQSPEPMACKIQILAPQPSSGDLEQDARAVFATMYPGWQHTRTGEQHHTLSRGILSQGLEYCMMEAQMSATAADGRYVVEDGAALVVRAANQIAIIAVRHGGLLAHNDCLNRYDSWRRFFNSFTIKHAPAAEPRVDDPAKRIIGVWSQSGGGAMGEYAFAANGHFALGSGLGSASTSQDDLYEYLHLRSHAWAGDGTYTIAGSELTLRGRGSSEPERVRFRFEQVNHGGSGWKDRLWLLKVDRHGQNEVGYEKRSAAPDPVASTAGAAPPSSRLAAPATAAHPSPAIRRGPPLPQAADVAGFYRLTKRVFDAAPFGPPGSGQWNHRKLYYLLSSDGQVFRGTNSPDVPGGDIESFDFDAARRRSPKDAGTYKVQGNEVVLTMGAAPHQIVIAQRSRDALKLNDPAFTYGEFTFFRSIRALPEAVRGPGKPPEVVRVPAASIPALLPGLPTLAYVAPAGFRNPTGAGRHESIATGQARVEVYDFRPFNGKDFEQAFRATRFRDWLAAASREDESRMVGETVFEPQTMVGAEQVFSATFQDGSEALREVVDTGAPRIRSRFAILNSGAVALVDLMIRDGEALQNQQAGLTGFSESLKILPAPPPMTRDEILALAGVWEWDGWSGFGPESLPHEEQAQIESYVFSVDGRAAWDHGKPDLRTFDFAQAAAAESTVGTYFKRGDQIVLRFGTLPYYVYSATIKGRDTLEILGYTYHRRQSVEAK